MNTIIDEWQFESKVDGYFERFRCDVSSKCQFLHNGGTLTVQVGSAVHKFQWPKTVDEMMVALEPDLRKALATGELD